SDQDSIEHVDLDGGFLMPSFGDGHAHPIFGGMEAEGPQVRACSSVDEIVAEVRRYAAAHPDEKWITGASYDGSLVAGGLFDARWLDEAVSDRPVVLRAWDYHTVWCNSRALELAGITAETPEPEIGEIPRREDGSPLGTLREWGAVDLIDAVRPPQEESVRLRALERAADYYRRRGATWVQDAWVEPAPAGADGSHAPALSRARGSPVRAAATSCPARRLTPPTPLPVLPLCAPPPLTPPPTPALPPHPLRPAELLPHRSARLLSPWLA